MKRNVLITAVLITVVLFLAWTAILLFAESDGKSYPGTMSQRKNSSQPTPEYKIS